jgi:hypothetical protein
VNAAISTRTPTAEFTMKIDFQDHTCSISPDPRRPTMPPTPANPAQVPTAVPRRSGGKLAVSSDRVDGMTNAAPIPAIARRRMSHSGESSHSGSTEDTVNSANPTMRVARRPKRSPRAPAVRTRAASASVYESTIQVSSAWVAPIATAMSGSEV